MMAFSLNKKSPNSFLNQAIFKILRYRKKRSLNA